MYSREQLSHSFSLAMLLLYAWKILPTVDGKPPQTRCAVEPEDYLDKFTQEEFEAIAEPTLRALPNHDNPFQALAIFEAYRHVRNCYEGKRLF